MGPYNAPEGNAGPSPILLLGGSDRTTIEHHNPPRAAHAGSATSLQRRKPRRRDRMLPGRGFRSASRAASCCGWAANIRIWERP